MIRSFNTALSIMASSSIGVTSIPLGMSKSKSGDLVTRGCDLRSLHFRRVRGLFSVLFAMPAPFPNEGNQAYTKPVSGSTRFGINPIRDLYSAGDEIGVHETLQAISCHLNLRS